MYAHHFLILTSVDPLAEKYYSISPYAYCAGNPVRYTDPNGMDIDVSKLTDKKQVAALLAIMQTEAGKKFLMQFIAKGQGLKFSIGGKTQTFMANENGKFASNTLTLKSEEVPNFTTINNGMAEDHTTYGQTNDLKKDGSGGSIDGTTNINNGINFEIKIDPTEGQSTDGYINTFLHEFYVHLDKTLGRLNVLSNSLNNGMTKVGSENYNNQILDIVNSADADHSNLARGGVVKYQNAANQIDLNRKMGIQLKKYNEDVKDQKSQGF